MNDIADFFIKNIITSPHFDSPLPVRNYGLLLPAFLEKVNKSIVLYQKSYPKQNIILQETYRSNDLQKVYYERGASKILKDGMHHFGIACDCAFLIDGKVSYKGDIELLRQIHQFNGLTVLGMWDALHVQYIPVEHQILLRSDIVAEIKTFQQQYNLPLTGEPDLVTRNKAITVYSNNN